VSALFFLEAAACLGGSREKAVACLAGVLRTRLFSVLTWMFVLGTAGVDQATAGESAVAVEGVEVKLPVEAAAPTSKPVWLGVPYRLLEEAPGQAPGLEEYVPEAEGRENWSQMLAVQSLCLKTGGLDAYLQRLRFQLENAGGKELEELGRGRNFGLFALRLRATDGTADQYCLLLVQTAEDKAGELHVFQYVQHSARMEASAAELARLACVRAFKARVSPPEEGGL